jgi:hypothetical protein
LVAVNLDTVFRPAPTAALIANRVAAARS